MNHRHSLVQSRDTFSERTRLAFALLSHRIALAMACVTLVAASGCPSTGPCTAPADTTYIAWGEATLSGSVVFDESHGQFHCISKSYRGTADTLRAFGFTVHAGSLASPADVRVVLPPRVPIMEVEATEVAAWVHAGGRLLILADHAPYPANLAKLTEALGFAFSAELVGPVGCVGDLAGDCGQYTFADSGIVTYSGVAVFGGEPLLLFGDDAQIGGESASGLAQLAIGEHGAGRVVVLGEARVLSASNRGGIQLEANRQLLLAIFAWLAP